MNEIGIILVCYGCTCKKSREKTLGKIEKLVKLRHPEYWVETVFSSEYMIEKVKDCEGISIMSLEEAVKIAMNLGIRKLVIQQLHLMNGSVKRKDIEITERYRKAFEQIEFGRNLLSKENEVKKIFIDIISNISGAADKNTAICFIAHGLEDGKNIDSFKLQNIVKQIKKNDCYIGVLHGNPSVEDLIFRIHKKEYKKVILVPLMLISGYHVNKNIVGAERESWKSKLEAENYEVTCEEQGIGEYEIVRQMLLLHIQEAVNRVQNL